MPTHISGDGERLEEIAAMLDRLSAIPFATTNAAFLRDLATRLSPEKKGDDCPPFTCCNWDELSDESKRAVESLVRAVASNEPSTLTAEERAKYNAARASVVAARNADPSPENSSGIEEAAEALAKRRCPPRLWAETTKLNKEAALAEARDDLIAIYPLLSRDLATRLSSESE